jgi:serine/threonine protein kinase
LFSGEFADVYKCRLKNRQTIRAVKSIPKRVNYVNINMIKSSIDFYRVIEKHRSRMLHLFYNLIIQIWYLHREFTINILFVFLKVVLREIVESPTHIYIVQDYIDGPNLFQK